jgi:hypothetical protein
MCPPKSRYLLALLAFPIASCVLPGDAAIKVTGTVVDEHGTPYSACVVSATYAGRELLAHQIREGVVDMTIVFHPTSRAPIILHFSCTGTRSVAERVIERMPDRFEIPVAFGAIVLPKS